MERAKKRVDTHKKNISSIDSSKMDGELDLDFKKRQFKLQRRQLWVSVAGFIIAILSIYYVSLQLGANRRNGIVALRGQLYSSEDEYQREIRNDDILNTLWVWVPNEIKGQAFYNSLISILTKDTIVLQAKNVEELYEAIWSFEAMKDTNRLAATKTIRKVFVYAQTILYHIHNAFDYEKDNILNTEEWETWKGSIREMSANPIFLASIYQGYKYDYFSKPFARFIYNEVCSPNPKGLKTQEDSLDYYRDREFIGIFYKDMLNPEWVNKMPDY